MLITRTKLPNHQTLRSKALQPQTVTEAPTDTFSFSSGADKFYTGALLTACGTTAGVAGAMLASNSFETGLLMVIGGTAAGLAGSMVFLD